MALKAMMQYVYRYDWVIGQVRILMIFIQGLANRLVHTVTGPGQLAITHYGGLYRLSLAAGEEYLVNPR